MYNIADVAGWQPHDLHGLAHASGVGSVLDMYRYHTTYNKGTYRIYVVYC